MTTEPKEGDRYDVSVLTGYKLHQERPGLCNQWAPHPDTGRYTSGCKCGKCNGVTTVHPGTVERLIYWADNSREAIVKCDDGETRRVMLAPPSGDICF